MLKRRMLQLPETDLYAREPGAGELLERNDHSTLESYAAREESAGLGRRGIGDWFRNLGSSIKNGFTSLGSKIKDGVTNVTSKIKDGVTNVASKIKNGVTNVASKIKNGVTNVASKIKDGVTNVASKIKDGASNAVAKVKSGISAAGNWIQNSGVGTFLQNNWQTIAQDGLGIVSKFI
jgi:prophage DNA circulation protein